MTQSQCVRSASAAKCLAGVYELRTKQSCLHVDSPRRPGLFGTETYLTAVKLLDDDATDHPRRSPIESECNWITMSSELSDHHEFVDGLRLTG